MIKRFLFKLFVFCFPLIFIFEATVRLTAPQQLIRFNSYFEPDNGLGLVPGPNQDVILNTGERPARYITDEFGHRVSNREYAPEIRILALGDSFIAAMQVDYDQTTTGLLEVLLSERVGKTTQVVNAASSSFGVNHYRIAARRELDRKDYKLALVFVNLSNDLVTEALEHYKPSKFPSYPLRLPRRLAFKEVTDAILYPINNRLETSSHLFVLLKYRWSVFLAQAGLTKRYFPQNLLVSDATSPSWSTSADVLSTLNDEARKKGVPVIYVFMPSIYQVDPSYLDWGKDAFNLREEDFDVDQPQRIMTQLMRDRNLEVVDLLPPMRAAAARGAELFGHIDTHLSPEGNDMVARYIDSYLREHSMP